MKPTNSGTKEWASRNINIFCGCRYDCGYCYAKKMAIHWGRATKETWKLMRINKKNVDRAYRKSKGRLMFSSTHDLFPDEPFFSASMKVLLNLLSAGNEVLLTSKPNITAIKKVCEQCVNYKALLQFRFTITSCDPKMLSRWEPNAPTFDERIACLKHAFQNGFETSISIEPCLDRDPRQLVELLKPFTTGTIWLGYMQYQKGYHVKDEDVALWYEWFSQDPKIKFKNSIPTSLLVQRENGKQEALFYLKNEKPRQLKLTDII